MKKWLGGLLALVALVALFVVVVAATLPAATAYRYLEPKLACDAGECVCVAAR